MATISHKETTVVSISEIGIPVFRIPNVTTWSVFQNQDTNIEASLTWKQSGHSYLYHEKSLMIKYSRMQKEIPSRLVFGSHGTCLGCTLLEVQVTPGLGFFLHSGHLIK